MKTSLTLIALSTLISTSAIAQDQEKVKEGISRVISSLDQTFVDDLITDYRPGSRLVKHKGVRIVLEQESAQDEIQKHGIAGHIAAYSPTHDTIIIPQKWSPLLEDALAHELWHATYDKKGERKGLIHRPGFSGPSVEEIEAFAKEFVQRESMAPVHEYVKRQKLTANLRLKLAKINDKRQETSMVINLFHTAVGAAKALDTEYGEPPLSQETGEKLLELSRTISAIESIEVEAKALFEKLKTRKKTLSFQQDIERVHDQLMKLDLSFERELLEHASREVILFEIARKQEAIDKVIESTKDGALKETFVAYRESVMDIAQMKLSALKMVSSTSLNSFLESIVNISNVSSIEETLTDANEVMARIIAALYTVHLGQSTPNLYQLEESDLRFLERFVYRGKKVFESGVMRYRAGLDLIKNNFSPKEAQKKLRYAHVSGNIIFSFAEREIIGDLPTAGE